MAPPVRGRDELVYQDDVAKSRSGRDKEKKSAYGERRRRRAAVVEHAAQKVQYRSRKIFIGGLSSDTTTQDLKTYFARFGAVADAVVLHWPDGRSRGFGYVTYASTSASKAVLCTQHVVGGRPVDVKPAVPGTNKLFVGGLPQDATATELREHFEAYGVVSDAVVMVDPSTSRSRGFGFVCFMPGEEGAAALCTALEQYRKHFIHGKWVDVKSAASPHKLGQEQTDALAYTAAGGASVSPWPMDAQPWTWPSSAEALTLQGAGLLPQPPSRREPQKVALPCATAGAKVPDMASTPPGLDGAVTRMAWGSGGESTGSSPWPSAILPPLGCLLGNIVPGVPYLPSSFSRQEEQQTPQAMKASVLEGVFPPPGLLFPPGLPLSGSS